MSATELKVGLFRSRNGLLLSLFLAMIFIGTVGLDQVSKYQMHKTFLIWEDPEDTLMYRGGRQPVFEAGDSMPEEGKVPLYFSLQWQYSRNRGAAFSLLADLDERIRVPFFYGVTIFAVVLIGMYLKSTPRFHHGTRCGLIMILSGAIGNFLDRVTRGYVVDFIDTKWNLFGWEHDFAIFNVADVAINIGVILLIADAYVQWRQEKRSASHSARASIPKA